jgi:hypothetical protein
MRFLIVASLLLATSACGAAEPATPTSPHNAAPVRIARRTPLLVADGEADSLHAGDPNAWLDSRERDVRELTRAFPRLTARLPVVVHLDRDFITAARTRQSIELVDDCGSALCGVATTELPGEWRRAIARALFTPEAASRMQRDAFAASLTGTFGDEDIDDWTADLLRAGVITGPADALTATEPLVAIPATASLLRAADPQHTMTLEKALAAAAQLDAREWRKRLLARPVKLAATGAPQTIHGATFSIVNRIEQSILADGSTRALQHLRSLGIDTIALVPFAGQRGIHALEIHTFGAHAAGETDLSMRLGASRAQRLGLRVVVKPQLWTGRGTDPTMIVPEGDRWGDWFASYDAYIVHQILLARLMHAQWFVIGTELSRTQARPEWHTLIRTARALFHGRITYAANHDAIEAGFWSELDAVGVDAYTPLSSKPDATDAELRAGAEAFVHELETFATAQKKPLLLTELGYASTISPWIEPWSEEREAESSSKGQTRAFSAMFGAMRNARPIIGWILWKYESDPDLHDPRGFNLNGKPAESLISAAAR